MPLSPKLCNGSYRVQFTHQGKRHTVYFGTDDSATATRLCRKLELDLLNGTLQVNLKAYSLKFEQSSNPGIQAIPSLKSDKGKGKALIELWDVWLKTLDLSPNTLNNDYWDVKKIIPTDALWDDVAWFKAWATDKANATIRKRKGYLKRCIQWHLSQGTIQGLNPWETIKVSNNLKSNKNNVNPFTETEISLILDAFKTNQFCPSASHFKHDHYLPLVKFLFTYGCRIGEALALTWDKVDFINDVITIDCAVSDDTSDNPYASKKVVKETKTGIINYLPITESIKAMLIELKDKSNNPLVFPGHKGKILSHARFRIIWKSILDGLGLVYRYPYMARHTVLSNVAKNHGLAAAASLAGHKDLTMVSKHYVKFIGDKKDIIPSLF